MKCEDIEKLLHLYFDGELDAEESKELEEHFLTCRGCATKLQELENLEENARRIRMPEPSADYWKTFAERVRNEIILRRRKSVWARLKSGWESFFFYSPAKLRIAAGIASILLVFIIGKLYWDYKGKELERVRSERMEKILSPQVQKNAEALSPTAGESLQVVDQTKQMSRSKSQVLQSKEEVSKVLAPQESISTLSEAQSQDNLKTQIGFVSKKTPAESLHVKGGRAGEVSKTVLPPESTSPLTSMSETLPETTLYIHPSPEEKPFATKTTLQAPMTVKKDERLLSPESIKYYKIDTSRVRALTEKDTLLEADTLKKVISTWKEYYEKKPVSEWAPEGFSQVEIAYKLLFLKTGDESLRQEGIKLLKRNKDSVTDQKFKEELTKLIAELEALKKK